jgi:hypothetical protein
MAMNCNIAFFLGESFQGSWQRSMVQEYKDQATLIYHNNAYA